MKHLCIFMSCILSIAFLQAESHASVKNCKQMKERSFSRATTIGKMVSACGCGGGGARQSEEIPPDYQD